ncbi:MAG: thymidine kinase [Bacilli bacterium]
MKIIVVGGIFEPKLYFTYGTMGSSKTAQALMLRFSFIEKDQKVLFLKPSVDTSNDEGIVKSRVEGLEAPVLMFSAQDNLLKLYKSELKYSDCVIIDEVNFASEQQINELKYIAEEMDIPVHTFGLGTNFQTKLFEGSKRLFEIADTIIEIKSPYHCGKKTIVNARYKDGKIIKEGKNIFIGGNDQYKSLCYSCWQKGILNGKKKRTKNKD